MNQTNLFDAPRNNDFPDYAEIYIDYCKTDIGKKAAIFDAENPHVWELFKRFAGQIRERGRKRFSSKAIFERIRWETAIKTTDDKFKLQNNHTAYYARKYMASVPGASGFFSLRG